MAKAVLSPVEAKRLAVFNEMTEATREIAQKILAKTGTLNKASLRTWHDIGQLVIELTDPTKVDKYGAKSVRQVAEVTGMGSEQHLGILKNFAEMFSIETLNKYGSGDHPLALTHFTAVMRITSEEKRLKYLDEAVAKRLSTRDLELRIKGASEAGRQNRAAGGGRPQSVPTATPAALQKAIKFGQSFSNYMRALAAGDIFAEIDNLDEDAVTPDVENKLKAAIEELDAVDETIKESLERMKTALPRVQELLAAKYKAAEARYDEQENGTASTEEPAQKTKPAQKAKPAKGAAKKAAKAASGAKGAKVESKGGKAGRRG